MLLSKNSPQIVIILVTIIICDDEITVDPYTNRESSERPILFEADKR